MIFRILEDQLAQKSRESKAADQRFMQLALTLGRRGQGRTGPNPAAGAAGVKVDFGLGAAEAGRDHAGHFRRVRDKRPHVILKLAVSSDDKIGAAGRKPVAISGEAAKARVHLLRAQCDAVLVGIGTVRADDPLLTCRLPGMAARSPVRVVLDRNLRIAGSSRLVHSARETPLWVMTSSLSEAPAAMKLGAAGAQVIRVATATPPPGLDLGGVLRALCEKGITRLLVE